MILDIEMKKSGLPRGVVADKYRDGSTRLVFRKDGRKVTLPGPSGSDAFWDAYALAKAGKQVVTTDAKPRAPKAADGTLEAIFQAYCRSAFFKENDTLTQKDKISVFESIFAEPLVPGKPLTFRTCPVKSLTKKHMTALRDRKAGFSTAANKRLTYMHRVFKWAVGADLMATNPAAGIERVSIRKGGYHTWTVDEVRMYEAKWPVGTKQRLALAIIGFAGLRISDACQLGKQHLHDGWIKKLQHKNQKRLPKMIEVPILPQLQAAIDACPSTGMTLLETRAHKRNVDGVLKPTAYSIKSFGGKFKDWCKEAGIPHCSAHGARKAAASIAAENGATEAQLMSIFGWEDAKEVITYIRKMRRRQMASEAMGLLVPRENENKNVPQSGGLENGGTKDAKIA